MKFNQYAYVEIDPKKQIEELKNINFLPVNFEKYNFSDLLGTLFKNLLAEAKTPEAKTAKLSEFAINENETLTTFLAQNPQAITKNEFYNVALQLLGYHVIYDYDLNHPIDCLNKHALPYIDKKEFTLNDLPEVFYRLLNTRSANGQILIDVMAAKGYFTQFWGKNEFLFLMANHYQFLILQMLSVKLSMLKVIWILMKMVNLIYYRQQSFDQAKVI